MENALDIILRDHRAVEEAYGKYLECPDTVAGESDKKVLAKEILDSLDMHGVMEEEYFYPEVRAASVEQGKEMIDHAEHEHAEMKVLIKTLQLTPVGSVLDRGMERLMNIVTRHVREEEEEILPQAEELLGEERLLRLGAVMAPHSPSGRIGNRM